MLARAHERDDGEMHRRHAARGAHRADAVLQRRQPLLQHRRGGIGDARVDVAGAFEIEQRGRVVGVLEHVGRGLIDRHGAGAGDRVGMLSGVEAQGFEGGRLWRWHVRLAGQEKHGDYGTNRPAPVNRAACVAAAFFARPRGREVRVFGHLTDRMRFFSSRNRKRGTL